MKIWTKQRTPFALGGTSRNIALDIAEPDWVDVGRGFQAGVVCDPKGVPHVVEKISGALIGISIIEVMEDIAACDDEQYLQTQVREASKMRDGATIVSSNVFWNMR